MSCAVWQICGGHTLFAGLSERLEGVFGGLRRKAKLTQADVSAALRAIRVALLEADVALPVVKDLMGRVKEAAVGADLVKKVSADQQVVKIVHDALVQTLGEHLVPLIEASAPPTTILVAGLQGSGKTTTSAKLGLKFKKDKKRALLASLDTRRPAAQEQLRVLGEQIAVATLPSAPGESPVQIAKRAKAKAQLEGYDVLILDSAGRLSIDAELMEELKQIRDLTQPDETFLIADAMTGQDAVNTAQIFEDQLGLTGLVLTRVDGDARGGAALSMRAVTGKPIKLLGVGEKMDALEEFHPSRIAARILGLGDVVSLVEKAQKLQEAGQAERLQANLAKGQFDLNDLADQMKHISKLGGMGTVLSMMPGLGGMKRQIEAARNQINDKMVARQLALISSMTPLERAKPEIIKAKRKQRIAAGSGTAVQDLNKLLKQYQGLAKMMKQLGKKGRRGGLSALPSERDVGALSQLGDLGGLGGAMPKGFPFKR